MDDSEDVLFHSFSSMSPRFSKVYSRIEELHEVCYLDFYANHWLWVILECFMHGVGVYKHESVEQFSIDLQTSSVLNCT